MGLDAMRKWFASSSVPLRAFTCCSARLDVVLGSMVRCGVSSILFHTDRLVLSSLAARLVRLRNIVTKF
jgi:hypothetical protein